VLKSVLRRAHEGDEKEAPEFAEKEVQEFADLVNTHTQSAFVFDKNNFQQTLSSLLRNPVVRLELGCSVLIPYNTRS